LDYQVPQRRWNPWPFVVIVVIIVPLLFVVSWCLIDPATGWYYVKAALRQLIGR